MASGVYNEGAYQLCDGIDFETDAGIKIMLVKSTYSFDKDHTLSTNIVSHEADASGYTGGFNGAGRKALATKTKTKNTTSDRIIFDADDPSAWTLAAGNTIGGAVIIREITSDAASTALFFLDFTDTATNGGTFTVSFDTNGIAYLAQ
jgi:hypothetical protein